MEFNLSDRIINPTKKIYLLDTYESIPVEDVKEFIRRRIERTIMICKLYPHKTGEELAGELNEDLIKDAGEKLI